MSSSESKCPTLKVEEKEDLRKKLEEKSKKYEHLPVYDRDEEKRNAEELREKMNKIFSDVDDQPEKVTVLTSAHLEDKGITISSSSSSVLHQTPAAAQTQGDPGPPHDSPQPGTQRGDYESLGHTFRDLTDKMETVTKDIQGHGDSEVEIPFVDEGSEEDYRENIRCSDGRQTYF